MMSNQIGYFFTFQFLIVTLSFAQSGSPICMFGAPDFYSLSPLSTPKGIVAADLDDDGDKDLVFCHSGSMVIRTMFNDGSGNFVNGDLLSVGANPRAVDAGDLDGDGDLDLAVANSGPTSDISILLNNGNGEFAQSIGYGAGNFQGLQSVKLGDLDSDGDLDVAAGRRNDGTITLLSNNGDGTFVALTPIAGCCLISSIDLADLDNDGDLDLATSNGSTFGFVDVFLNDGVANFSFSAEMEVGDCPRFVLAADLDSDGDQDLVSADFVPDNVSIFINNGDGTFADRIIVETCQNPEAIAAADIDGDSDIDLAVACALGNNVVSILLNDGSGNFSQSTPVLSGTEPNSIVLFDVDGDQDIDLVNTNFFSFDISVIFNSCVLLGDVNRDGVVDLLDVSPFVTLLAIGKFQTEADINQDGSVDLLDVTPFVLILAG